ncbi:MAG: acetoin utilization protein AcuC [Candidatus Thorarchaeota archaeon]|nr:MAG: acetoin utilization protein AcuC [Candidatus Thorarchaeota archaeon]
MRGKLVYPYSDSLLEYEFSQEHPLKPERLKLTYLLSKQLGLLDKVKIIEPTPATRAELELFHSTEYLDAVQKWGEELCSDYKHGIGTPDNPVFPKIYETGAKYVGATLDGMKQIIDGASNAFCILGGLHHAHRNAASGFCIFNDVAIAINYLQKKKNCRVLYFDIDAHHGDGVQNAFYRSKDILTISIHQTGKTLFPGTGFVYETGGAEGTGYSINVPVIPGAGSLELIKIYNEIVRPLFESYKPNLLVTQLGVDGHYNDPLAHLAYTSYGYETVLKGLRTLSSDICNLGWLAVGGGGYHPVTVARLWTLFLAIMLDEKIPEKIPEDFKQSCESLGYSNCPERMRDEEDVVQMYFSRDEVSLDLDRTIRKVKELAFPYHGL